MVGYCDNRLKKDDCREIRTKYLRIDSPAISKAIASTSRMITVEYTVEEEASEVDTTKPIVLPMVWSGSRQGKRFVDNYALERGG